MHDTAYEQDSSKWSPEKFFELITSPLAFQLITHEKKYDIPATTVGSVNLLNGAMHYPPNGGRKPALSTVRMLLVGTGKKLRLTLHTIVVGAV